MTPPANSQLRLERWKLTARVVRMLETPMLVLSVVWTTLLILELTRGLSPWLALVNDLVWAAFVAEFALEFLVAPGVRLSHRGGGGVLRRQGSAGERGMRETR